MKRQVEVKDYFGYYDLQGNINSIIERLRELQQEHGKELTIDIDSYDEYGSICHSVRIYRLETDAEESARMEADARLKVEFEAKQAEERKKQYEALKKEFGE